METSFVVEVATVKESKFNELRFSLECTSQLHLPVPLQVLVSFPFHELTQSDALFTTSLPVHALILLAHRYTNMQVTCSDCQGKGTVIRKPCPHCHSAKIIPSRITLSLHLPKGAPEGFEVVFDGDADESPDWDAGDV